MKSTKRNFFSYLVLSLALSLPLLSPKAHAFPIDILCGAFFPAVPANLPGHPVQVNNYTWTGFVSFTVNTQVTSFISVIYNQNRTVLGSYNATNVIPGCSKQGTLYPVTTDFDIIGLSPTAATHVRLERTGLNTWKNTVTWNGVKYIRNYSN